MKTQSRFLTGILCIIFIFGCHKEETPVVPFDSGSGNSFRTSVSGMVLDDNNVPLNWVSVTAYGQTTVTNQYGVFVLKNINGNKSRCILNFSKAGFFNRSHGLIASGNTVNYVRIVLLSNTASQTISASAGGTVNLPDGSSVQFEPNSFVNASGSAYTGTVNIAFKHLSPDDANFGFTIPGGDLRGINSGNENVTLYTYGMLRVELTGSGNESLQLAMGKPASLTFAIAASQLSSAPSSIPLWYFDETTSLWKEEGTASKVGNNYVGTVNHFSWWNCDIGPNSPIIKGKVVDCNGTPVPNIVVTVAGWATTLTDQNGEWQGVVPGNNSLSVQVLASYNPGITMNSQLLMTPVLSNNQTYIVPDIVIPCPTRVIGTIKSCTGQNVDGMVYISGNNLTTFQYTATGEFNMVAMENSTLQLEAYHSNLHHSQSINTPFAPNILNAGNILLCDILGITDNHFILTGGGFTSQLFNISISSSSASVTDTAGNGYTNVSLTGTASLNFNITNYHITIPDTVPASTTCYLSISMTDPTGIVYYIYGQPLPCTLTEVSLPGGRVKGNYYGTAVTYSNGSSSSGSIEGTFDVPRIQ